MHKQWNTWVENPVVKIRNLHSPRDWYHVPGSLNPADVATRSISAKDLNCDSVWFVGPKVLYSRREHWPRANINDNSVNLELESTVTTVNLNT